MSSMSRIAQNRCEKFGHEIRLFLEASPTPNGEKLMCQLCGMTLSEIRDENPNPVTGKSRNLP